MLSHGEGAEVLDDLHVAPEVVLDPRVLDLDRHFLAIEQPRAVHLVSELIFRLEGLGFGVWGRGTWPIEAAPSGVSRSNEAKISPRGRPRELSTSSLTSCGPRCGGALAWRRLSSRMYCGGTNSSRVETICAAL